MESNNGAIEINPTDFRILIVDDMESNVMLLKALLKTQSYEILTAYNGPEALEKVAREHPDMILLDVMMPGISGFEVAAQLQNSPETREIPIMFITALNSHEDIVKGFQSGASDFISKPFNKSELMIRVNHQISLIAAKRIIRKQNEELKSTIQGRDKLYSVIAHDLRGPLGTIKMILNLLTSTLEIEKIDPESFNLLTVANKTTEDVFSLLDNLLKWTKSQLGKLNVARQTINISEILSDGIEVFRTMADMKGVSIAMEEEALCQVIIDADMIKTVLRNLISNAIKFTPGGGTVTVGLRADDPAMVVVSVRDTGCGIKEEDQSRLMRADTHFSTFGTNSEEGAGLGLLLCQDFVRKNGGELWFESKKNEGSTFFFSIPKA